MHEEQLIIERLEALEKQNRRMKQIGALVMMIAASLFLMGQTAKKRTVEANEFILRDNNGIVKAKWVTDADGPRLSFLDSNGKDRATLSVALDGTPWLSFSDPSGGIVGERIILGNSMSGPQLIFKHQDRVQVGLFGGALGSPSEVSLELHGTPSITIDDKEGYSTTIGSIDLVTERTGESHKTSAASVILFGKDKKVLWKAP